MLKERAPAFRHTWAQIPAQSLLTRFGQIIQHPKTQFSQLYHRHNNNTSLSEMSSRLNDMVN